MDRASHSFEGNFVRFEEALLLVVSLAVLQFGIQIIIEYYETWVSLLNYLSVRMVLNFASSQI